MELGHRAAQITFEFNVAQGMLRTCKLFFDAKLGQRANATTEFSWRKLSRQLIHPVVGLATVEGRVTPVTFVEHCLFKDFDLFLRHCLAWWVLAVSALRTGCIRIIKFGLLHSFPDYVSAENFESVKVIIQNPDMLNSTNIGLAGRAVHEGEVDLLGAPSRT